MKDLVLQADVGALVEAGCLGAIVSRGVAGNIPTVNVLIAGPPLRVSVAELSPALPIAQAEIIHQLERRGPSPFAASPVDGFAIGLEAS